MEVNDVRYVFDTSVLKKGDVLLINTYNERMHLLMKSQYDHVALYAGDAFIMESDGGGVVLNHIFSYGFKEVDDAIVLRCKSDSELIREGVVFYARSTMGMEFGSLEARKVPKPKFYLTEDEKKRFTYNGDLIVSSLARKISDLKTNEDMRNLRCTSITNWLLSLGYLKVVEQDGIYYLTKA